MDYDGPRGFMGHPTEAWVGLSRKRPAKASVGCAKMGHNRMGRRFVALFSVSQDLGSVTGGGFLGKAWPPKRWVGRL
jgi:hypothetical protein